MANIALIGAAGAIGQSVANALDQKGQHYRVVGRNRASLDTTFSSSKLAEIMTWNPDDPDSARAAVRGTDTLVYLVGVPYNKFHLHPILMRKTVDAAMAEGVEYVVLIGTVYPYGRPQTTPLTEEHPRQPHTFKGKMRKEQEDILLGADAEGKLRATILRLPDFYGPNVERSFLHSLFQAAAQGKTANMLGPTTRLMSSCSFPMSVRSSSLWPKSPRRMDAPGIWRVRAQSPSATLPSVYSEWPELSLASASPEKICCAC
jgi:nucleoside-diphosphate-sugar epimerase